MDYDLLLASIARHISLTKEEETYFVSLLHPKRAKRKQFLLQEGGVNTAAIFVTAGCLRSYAIDRNGFEHVLQFAPPGWWISDMRSLIRQQPATLNIDAIEPSEAILLPKDGLDALFLKIPKFERFFRILAENALATYQHRLTDNLSLPAMERYNNFCRLYPSLIQCLPQKQIAAYIGVTPEFLSKMLNTKITQKQHR